MRLSKMKLIINVFVFTLQLVLILCDVTAFDYCSLNDSVCNGTTHIVCGSFQTKLENFNTNLTINITTERFSDDDKNSLIDFMNENRNKIALGQMGLPKASNMEKTVWDDELELLAKSFAEVQLMGDDYCFTRSNGREVYLNTLTNRSKPQTAQTAIRDILDDPKHRINTRAHFDELYRAAFLTKIGCYFGTVMFDNRTDLVQGGISCMLDFAEQLDDAPSKYTEGEPCTKCKDNLGCDSKFTGLCAST